MPMAYLAYLAYLATSAPEVADFFRTLADDTRLAIIRMLALSDRKAGELGGALRLPSNAVSYHLKQLRSLGLLHERQSSADGRAVYYQLDVDRLAQLYADAGDALHPGLAASLPQPVEGGETEAARSSTRLRVLFLCTHNSARSQLAEALMRQMGGEYVEVYSAGSMPTEVHPDTIIVLQGLGIDPSPLYAKSLDRFVGEPLDYIITVCDRVRDICPSFTGDPNQAHWSFPDPVVVEDPEQRLKAFRQVAAELRTRIGYLLLLPHPRTGERFSPRRS
jgi:ArsR family transcriptional regulator, arsenate/arsenite/antimonite-responsive transcriptional repressor / arsenate reductase (thioredoxin)